MNRKELAALIIIGLIIIGLIFLIGFMAYIIIGYPQIMHENQMDKLRLEKEIALINNNVTYTPEYASLDVLLRSIDKIKKDCGGTHIVKKYGSNHWSVFIWENSIDKRYLQIRDCYKEEVSNK